MPFPAGTHGREAERFTAETLVRKALGEDVTICHDPDGAPFAMTSGGGRLSGYVSISHSSSNCALAVSDFPVGIDLEAPREQLRRIASRFLTPAERKSMQEPYSIVRLLEMWTAKEAVFKCASIPSLVISEIETVLPPAPAGCHNDRDGGKKFISAVARGKKFDVSCILLPSSEILAVAVRDGCKRDFEVYL